MATQEAQVPALRMSTPPTPSSISTPDVADAPLLQDAMTPIARSGRAAGIRTYLKLAAIPIAALVALAVHRWVPDQELTSPRQLYPLVLWFVFGFAVVAGALQFFWRPLARWLGDKAYVLA